MNRQTTNRSVAISRSSEPGVSLKSRLRKTPTVIVSTSRISDWKRNNSAWSISGSSVECMASTGTSMRWSTRSGEKSASSA